MRITSLRTYNWRNLSNGTVDFDSANVVLYGENAQGKTNLLEALYTACYGTSFRSKQIQHSVSHGEQQMALELWYKEGNRTHHCFFQVINGKKRMYKDGNVVKRTSDLFKEHTCVVFVPEDIALVQGSPQTRRDFLNQWLCQYFIGGVKPYAQVLQHYQKTLVQRNALLKQGDISLLDLYDKELAKAGITLMELRREGIMALNEVFSPLYSEIAGVDSRVYLSYKTSWQAETLAKIEEHLKATRDKDLALKTTSSGPHRDGIFYLSDLSSEEQKQNFNQNRDMFELWASMGQQRLIVLILKLSTAILAPKEPLLFFDDILLELDVSKRKKFVEKLPRYGQCFYTFLPNEYYFYEDSFSAMMYQIQGGRIHDRTQ